MSEMSYSSFGRGVEGASGGGDGSFGAVLLDREEDKFDFKVTGEGCCCCC